ncbi:MAG: DUF1320 family protein [Candidatus Eisenbacteria bacterium]|uniref:DUF1320 family protein n=1 Tax=Eiseniibacteriota bacterium TaxID=2212470 RepID=A0A956LXW5_UNCEI|nr:DUF1320 family protein [Candidatus Eisenbacteria bacterium]
MAYATNAGVLDVSKKIQKAIDDDATVVADTSGLFADPIIDARLAGRGAPFTTAPSVVVAIACYITASVIWQNRLSQDNDESGLAKTWYERGMDLLEKVATGEMPLDGVTNNDSIQFGDINPTQPYDAMFVGDELDYQERDETRATS